VTARVAALLLAATPALAQPMPATCGPHCLTGFAKRETLSMFDANLEDIRYAISRNCR